jgi:hypothetical protein
LQLDQSWETWLDHTRAGGKMYLCVGVSSGSTASPWSLSGSRVTRSSPSSLLRQHPPPLPALRQRHQRLLLTMPFKPSGRPSRQQQHRRSPVPKQEGPDMIGSFISTCKIEINQLWILLILPNPLLVSLTNKWKRQSNCTGQFNYYYIFSIINTFIHMQNER